MRLPPRIWTTRSLCRVLCVGLCSVLAACEDRAFGVGEPEGGVVIEAPATCDMNFARLEGAARVSFREDVMPVFGLACASQGCHAGGAPAAHLYLGVRCKYDAATRACVFPDSAALATDPNAPQLLTTSMVDAAYHGLLGRGVTAPDVMLVKPGDPATSFLVEKLAGVHNDRGHDCSAAARGGPGDGPCGAPMPFGSAGLCGFGERGQQRFDTVAAWVAQGALNN